MSEEQISFTDAAMKAMEPEPPKEAPPAPEPPKQEAPPAPEPKTEEPKAPDTPPTEPKTEDASDQDRNWKELREAKKTLEAERLTALAEIDKLKGELSKFDQGEIDKLKSDYDSLSAELATVDAYRSPEVKKAKERVTTMTADAVKAIRRLLPEAEGLEDTVSLPPDLRDQKLAALLEEASPAAASRVWTLVDRVDEAKSDMESLAESAKAKSTEWKAEQTRKEQQQQAEATAQTERLYQAGLEAAIEEMPDLFTVEGTEEQKQQTLDRINYAKRVLSEPMTPEETVQTAFLAGIGKTALLREKAFTAAVAELKTANEDLQTRINELENASPGAGGTSPDNTAPAIKPGTFADTVLSMTGE